MVRWAAFFIVGVALALSPDELKLFQDPGGWEYQTITEANNGFKTEGTCFTETYTGRCRGNLFFREDGSFTQVLSGSGRSMHRGGRYELNGNQLTFWDEHDTKDGPYAVTLKPASNMLRIETTQAGVVLRMDLMLEREFKKTHH
jgi:hypothetical protein